MRWTASCIAAVGGAALCCFVAVPAAAQLDVEWKLNQRIRASSSTWATALAPADRDSPPDDGRQMDVLVLYTPSARLVAGSTPEMWAAIVGYVSETDHVFQLSGVRLRLNLVGAFETEDDDDGPYASHDGFGREFLDRVRAPNDGYMDDVPVMRNRTSADLVHLLVGGYLADGISGTAWGGFGRVGALQTEQRAAHSTVRA